MGNLAVRSNIRTKFEHRGDMAECERIHELPPKVGKTGGDKLLQIATDSGSELGSLAKMSSRDKTGNLDKQQQSLDNTWRGGWRGGWWVG
jgi:hypothetical protein